jgi:hypothetical protein
MVMRESVPLEIIANNPPDIITQRGKLIETMHILTPPIFIIYKHGDWNLRRALDSAAPPETNAYLNSTRLLGNEGGSRPEEEQMYEAAVVFIKIDDETARDYFAEQRTSRFRPNFDLDQLS